jgi:hypothetical protein
MWSTLRKLILSTPQADSKPAEPAFHKIVRNAKSIWNNEKDDDIGLEKLFRLFLAVSQFLFLGTYIKQLFGTRGIAYRDLAIDVFVLLKVIYPLLLLKYEWFQQPILFWIMIWFSIETFLYAPRLIFASDIYIRPRSYRRSIMLLFLNYLEIVFSFAVIYASGNHFQPAFTHWFDPIYFSLITSATIGYGDFHPITPFAKVMVSIQSILFVIFIVLFLNFFTNKIQVSNPDRLDGE